MNHLSEHLRSLGINRPTLVLDEEKVKNNISRMQQKVAGSSCLFRPHFKTHQSAEIGEWFRDAGTTAITVSSVDMAAYFAAHGWEEITIAFALNLLEIDAIQVLAERTKLDLLTDSEETVRVLDENLKHDVGMWIKIDVGCKRTGIWWEQVEQITALAQAIDLAKHISFKGVLTHSGHAYAAGSLDGIHRVFAETRDRLTAVKQELEQQSLGPCLISVGDTPGCSVSESFEGIDEIRPGNFVFYDLMQLRLSTCQANDIGTAVVCPVICKNKQRGQVIAYGGAVHFAKDSLVNEQGGSLYGCMAAGSQDTWDQALWSIPLASMSQEHGILETGQEFFDSIEIGELVPILPVHSCLTCDLFSEYLTLEGRRIERRQSNFQESRKLFC